MIIRTFEDKLINTDQYKMIYKQVDSKAHATSYALMITDYEHTECLGCWDDESVITSVINNLSPSFMTPENYGYYDLNRNVPSTMPAPEVEPTPAPEKKK